MIKVRRALLSVADKSGIVEFAQALADRGIAIVSTGGTAAALRAAGIEVEDAAARTGFGAALSGRVKTLHPALLGGILADRDNPAHASELSELGGELIDLAAVNFYPFGEAVAAGAAMPELVENIDIGGPTMVRAAAKNHRHVAIASDPSDYPHIIAALAAGNGSLPRELAAELAAKAFARTCAYDQAIAAAFDSSGFPPPSLNLALGKIASLRYGENPHQPAAAYAAGAAGFATLAGGEVSYNNLQDAVAAWRCVAEHEQPACAVVKHVGPCGIAAAADVAQALQLALSADPVAAYGGVVACNRPLNAASAAELAKRFVEVLVVPELGDEERAILAHRKRLRIIAGPLADSMDYDVRMYGGLALCQQRDVGTLSLRQLQELAGDDLDGDLGEQLLFAWRACKHAKSNAIVIARGHATIGIGAGQPSRVEAARLAVAHAQAHGHSVSGAVAASDGFLPFPDTLEILAQAGVAALIQPGGSKRDSEVAEAAAQAGVRMVMAGMRHFAH